MNHVKDFQERENMTLSKRQIKAHEFRETDGIKHNRRNYGTFENMKCCMCGLKVRFYHRNSEYTAREYKSCND